MKYVKSDGTAFGVLLFSGESGFENAAGAAADRSNRRSPGNAICLKNKRLKLSEKIRFTKEKIERK